MQFKVYVLKFTQSRDIIGVTKKLLSLLVTDLMTILIQYMGSKVVSSHQGSSEIVFAIN